MTEPLAGLSYAWAAILGLIQGFTEFLPVSSSGHLALAGQLGGGVPQPESFDILLHLATVLAVLAAFRTQLIHYWREERIVFLYLVVGSIPAAVVGLTLRHQITSLREVPMAVCGALLLTGAALIIAERTKVATVGITKLGFVGSLVVGCCQAFALVPGISRSGLTITGGLVGGLSREDAVRFSFLLGVPAILGAVLLTVLKMVKAEASLAVLVSGPYLLGFVVAGVSGYAAIHVMLAIVKNCRLIYFAAYCGVAGIAGLIWFGLFQNQ